MPPDFKRPFPNHRPHRVNMRAPSEKGKAAIAHKCDGTWNSSGNQSLSKWNPVAFKLAVEKTEMLLACFSVTLNELHHLLADHSIFGPCGMEEQYRVLFLEELVQILVTYDLDHCMSFLPNVKVMAHPLAGASVERGVDVELG